VAGETGDTMTTKQPVWEYVANLGDVNIAEYGGFIIYRDTTGVYPPEIELYESDEGETGGNVYRFIMERKPASEWWYKKLRDVARSCGQSVKEYHADLASGDLIRMASVYSDVVGYFGPFEFDQYPLRLTEAEAHKRYDGIKERR
jgi:hypothetical protein